MLTVSLGSLTKNALIYVFTRGDIIPVEGITNAEDASLQFA